MWAKTASMTVRPAPLTPSDASRAVARFDAPSAWTRSKTTPCQARTSSSVLVWSSTEARSSPLPSASNACPARRSRQARAVRSAARSAAARTAACRASKRSQVQAVSKVSTIIERAARASRW